jgi:hypothetical protein
MNSVGVQSEGRVDRPDIDRHETLHIDRKFIVLYVTGILALAAAGEAISWDRASSAHVVGLIMRDLCLVVALVLSTGLLPGSNQIGLSRGGLTLVKSFRRREYGWHQVGPFATFVPGYNITGRPLVTLVVFKITHGARAGRRVPVAVYRIRGLDPDRLAAHLNGWRDAALHPDTVAATPRSN